MKENIVFLESSAVNYGDLDFSEIAALGDLTCYTATNDNEVFERCKNASIAITNKVVFNSDVISQCPNLKMIAEAATGYNNIDVAAAKKKNIAVANVPGYSTSSVAQHTMAFILSLSTNLIKYNDAAHDGRWSASPSFTLGTWPVYELEGKTIGIMGYGAIGKEVAKRCSAFGMNVIALKRDESTENSSIQRMPLKELIQISDFISIHMPLTDYSKHLVNSEFLSNMKKSAFLINMARGLIVDSAALCYALEKGLIAGAAIDVMETEPPLADDPLLKAPNLIITPHIGWASIESRKRLVHEVAENIKAFLAGEQRNFVSL